MIFQKRTKDILLIHRLISVLILKKRLFILGENKRMLVTLMPVFCSILLMAPEDHLQAARRGLSANDLSTMKTNTNNRKRERGLQLVCNT